MLVSPLGKSNFPRLEWFAFESNHLILNYTFTFTLLVCASNAQEVLFFSQGVCFFSEVLKKKKPKNWLVSHTTVHNQEV
jgi:hypothetical protein